MVPSDLPLNGVILCDHDLWVKGNLSVEGIVFVNGDLIVQGSLNGTGALAASGRIAIKGSVAFQATAEVHGFGAFKQVYLGFIPPIMNLRNGTIGPELAWFETEPGLALESSESLSPPNWQPVTGPAAAALLATPSEHKRLPITLTGTAKYFRLRKTAAPAAR